MPSAGDGEHEVLLRMPVRETIDNNARRLGAMLLEWYGMNARDLPWRATAGKRPDPYRVWLSEIMLQQTTVATVRQRYAAFVARWPDVRALADAKREEVLDAWAGLGYYARARNMHACARVVAQELNGEFPQTPRKLERLPGIGPYTAAAIAAIAFGHATVAMDTNAERVVARLFAVQDPLPRARGRLRELAREMLDEERPGDFAQALMDLGATICTARAPSCASCPLRTRCQAANMGNAALLPRKERPGKRPTRRGDAYWIERDDGMVLLRRRPPRGMLGGMLELPSHGWDTPSPRAEAPPLGLRYRPLDATVRHVFTHFSLELRLWRIARPLEPHVAERLPLPEGWFWQVIDELEGTRLPALMRKATRLLAGAHTAGRMEK